jgi:hypothetical protein
MDSVLEYALAVGWNTLCIVIGREAKLLSNLGSNVGNANLPY